MRSEELAGRVNQQTMQLRSESRSGGQSQVLAYPFNLWSHRFRPPGLIDRDPTLGDLPGIAHAFVQARLALDPMMRLPGNTAEPARSMRSDRKSNPADATNLQVKIVGGGSPARGKFPRPADPAELSPDFEQR